MESGSPVCVWAGATMTQTVPDASAATIGTALDGPGICTSVGPAAQAVVGRPGRSLIYVLHILASEVTDHESPGRRPCPGQAGCLAFTTAIGLPQAVVH